MTIVIESGVELPKATRVAPKRESKYPFAQMQVGQSFAVSGDPAKCAATIRNAAGAYRKKAPGVKFAVRMTDTGARIWRTV